MIVARRIEVSAAAHTVENEPRVSGFLEKEITPGSRRPEAVPAHVR